jgi:hypothetical protein
MQPDVVDISLFISCIEDVIYQAAKLGNLVSRESVDIH